jgi:ribosome-binding ATPase YchF (GTP1/OBG family)
LYVAGEKEIRCWTIPRGCLAPQAAGAIHSDFERGFIKAEVVTYQDFYDLCEGGKSMGPIKAAGKYRQEGKSYVCTHRFRLLLLLLQLTLFSPRLSKTETSSTSNSVS